MFECLNARRSDSLRRPNRGHIFVVPTLHPVHPAIVLTPIFIYSFSFSPLPSLSLSLFLSLSHTHTHTHTHTQKVITCKDVFDWFLSIQHCKCFDVLRLKRRKS